MAYIEGQKLGKELGLLECSADFKRGFKPQPQTKFEWKTHIKELAILGITILIFI